MGPVDGPRIVRVHVTLLDISFRRRHNGGDGRTPPPDAARALPPRLDARGRRRARHHDVERLAGDRRAGPRRRHPAARARRPPRAADARRAAAGRPRRHDPRRGGGGAARPRPDRGAGRRAAGRRVRLRDPPVAAAGRSTTCAARTRASRCASTSTSRSRRFDLLARDDVDLALVYDYDLAPAEWRDDHEVPPLWDLEWGIGVPTARPPPRRSPTSPTATGSSTRATPPTRTRCAPWPRGPGFVPRVVHRIDSLELVDDLDRRRRGSGPAAARAVVAARRERRTAAGPGGQAPGVRRRPAAGATRGRRCGR